jgi:hypothetical protein
MSSQLAKERRAIYALIVFLVGWIVVMLAIQIVEGINSHVGFGVNQHVPASLVRQIGVGDNLQKMMNATNRP